MFSAEKLLGGMLKESLGLRGFRNKSAMGAGLLGLAFAAAEHFMNKSQSTFSGGGMQQGNSPNAAPPPPPPGAGTPPPVRSGAGTPPPPPPAGIAAQQYPEKREQDAVLLIRAMIASAASDGEIDDREKQNIITRLESVDLSDEEREFIMKELASPCDIKSIISQVKTPELARQVYTVSIMAVEVDTDAERDYLNNLAEGLGLDEAVKKQIHEDLGESF